MDKHEKGAFMQLFKDLDKNKDGFVSYEELRSGLMASRTDEPIIKEVMKFLDLNRDGKVSFNEFMSALQCALK